MTGAARMQDDTFWKLIEAAWQRAAPRLMEVRARLARGRAEDEDLEQVQEVLERVLVALREALGKLPKEDLAGFDRTLEAHLYRLDREELHQHTDGSDDGFLYCRGFIVAVGRAYFEAVDRDPSRALMGAECEDMTYLPWHLYRERFGEELPPSGISRETGSNAKAW